MNHLSGGDGLEKYVESVTGGRVKHRNAGKGTTATVTADPLVIKKLTDDIKAQTAEILEKTQALYEMQTAKETGDFLTQLEIAANKIL
jgi:hypothetical protein